MTAAPPLPLPPGDLNAQRLPIAVHGGPWIRVHPETMGALFFGKMQRYRFDAPDGSYGVLYAGENEACAFVETFLRVPRTSARVSRRDLATRAISVVTARRPVRLVDLTGHHLAQLRVDSNIFATTEYAITQAWSKAFFAHPDAPDGLLFHSRHDPSVHAVALFDRVEAEVEAQLRVPSIVDAAFATKLGEILDRYDVALI